MEVEEVVLARTVQDFKKKLDGWYGMKVYGLDDWKGGNNVRRALEEFLTP